MSVEENKKTVAWILQDLDPSTADAFADDLVYEAKAHPGSLPAADAPRGKAYVIESFERLKEMGGLQVSQGIKHVTADENRVVVESHNQTTGNQGFQIFEFVDGKVSRWRTYEDTAFMNAFRRDTIEQVQGRE